MKRHVKSRKKALKKGSDTILLPERSSSIYIINDSPISKKKAQTSLYRLAGTESDFAKMSLENEFNQEYFGMIKSRNLKDYVPLCAVGEIVIYKHRSKREWYCTEHMSGKPEKYESSEVEIKRWANNYYYLKLAYLNRHIFFESYIQQVLFEKYIKV